MLQVGIKNNKSLTVSEEKTALSMGSGSLRVFATPAMIALMEATAAESVLPYLEQGTTSVGTKVNISHLAADPVGMTVLCESELIEIDGRRMVFKVVVHDEQSVVGEGIHERFVVKTESFMKKTEAKLNV
ncbi:MAG: thioesterase [Ruminococcaceae bacterium]|nr:thioesterase [Oscillospiraceae bacterium]